MTTRIPALVPGLAALALLSTTACREAPAPASTPPASVATTPTSSETTSSYPSDRPDRPRLSIENPIVDFGQMGDYEQREAVVRFRNTGSQPLKIRAVRPTCGCTSVGFDTSRIYASGEEGEIVLAFTPKGSGKQQKMVSVVSSDSKMPVQEITIKAVIDASLAAEPRVLRQNRVPYRETSTGETILTALRPGIMLDDVTLSGDLGPGVTARIAPIEPDAQGRARWRATVEFGSDMRWGWFAGSMLAKGTIETKDGPQPVKMNFAVNGSVEGLVNAADSMFRFLSVRPSTEIEKSVDLTRTDGRPFRCLGVEVRGGGSENLTATPVPLTPDGTQWRIDLQGRAPAKAGSFLGEVFVQTDVPGEEVVRLKYGGVVPQ